MTVVEIELALKNNVYQYGRREYRMKRACFIICCDFQENTAGSCACVRARKDIGCFVFSHAAGGFYFGTDGIVISHERIEGAELHPSRAQLLGGLIVETADLRTGECHAEYIVIEYR